MGEFAGTSEIPSQPLPLVGIVFAQLARYWVPTRRRLHASAAFEQGFRLCGYNPNGQSACGSHPLESQQLLGWLD
jgi:hypothetical protein